MDGTVTRADRLGLDWAKIGLNWDMSGLEWH